MSSASQGGGPGPRSSRGGRFPGTRQRPLVLGERREKPSDAGIRPRLAINTTLDEAREVFGVAAVGDELGEGVRVGAARPARPGSAQPTRDHESLFGPGHGDIEQPNPFGPGLVSRRPLGATEARRLPPEERKLGPDHPDDEPPPPAAPESTGLLVDLSEIDMLEVEPLGAVDGHHVDRIRIPIGFRGRRGLSPLLHRPAEKTGELGAAAGAPGESTSRGR